MSKNQTIQHKRSTVSGNKPTTAQVEKGELAINFADRALYTQTAGGTIIELASDIFVGTSFAGTPVNGDMWYNTTDGMMKIWNGTAWTNSTQSGKPVLPANTTASVAFSSGAGTSASPYVFSATASAGDVKAINKITITNLVAGQYVPIVDLSSASNGGRFSVTNNIADASGTLVFVIMFTDAPTSGSGVSYTASFKVGTGTVYINPTMSIASSFPQTVNTPTGADSVSTPWSAAADTITATGSLLISTDNSTFSAGPLSVTTGATLYTKWSGTAGSGTGIDGAHGSTITGGLSSSSGATSSTSLTVDKTPAAISFTSQTGVGLGASVTSDTVTISGVNSYVYLTSSDTITASIAGGTFNSVPASGTTRSILNGQTLAIRQTASATANTPTTVTISAGGTSGTFTVTTTASGTINTPTITSPLPAATGISLVPTITASAYATTGPVGTHLNTDWQIATDSLFTAGVISLSANTTSLTSWSLCPLGLVVNTPYWVKVRYRSNDGTAVVSDWSTPVTFTTVTVNAFTTLQAGDSFGRSFALSSDGNTMVVGADYEDGGAGDPVSNAGSVFVFTRCGTTWTQQAQLWASDLQANDYFAWALALSPDGNTLAVGSYYEDGGASNISDSGSVYIFTRSGTTWSQQQQIFAGDAQASDGFGWAVTLSSDGNTLAVAANNEDGGVSNILSAGSVYVFTRSGTTWTQQQQLFATVKGINNYFGTAISLSGDGNTLVVGASNYSQSVPVITTCGIAYVFTRSGTTWTIQQVLQPLDKASGDNFGNKVSLSNDGNTLAVAANNEDGGVSNIMSAGCVYIFTRSGAVWTEKQQLFAGDLTAFDGFGGALMLSSDGNTLAVGASGEDGGPTNPANSAGTAYIFTFDGTTWTQQAQLWASDLQASDFFAWALALSPDGNTLAVGSYLEDGGTGNGANGAGSAYVFTRSGTSWTQQAQMVYSDGTNVGGVII